MTDQLPGIPTDGALLNRQLIAAYKIAFVAAEVAALLGDQQAPLSADVRANLSTALDWLLDANRALTGEVIASRQKVVQP